MLSPSAFFKICFCFYQVTARTMEKVQRYVDLSQEEIAGLIDGKDSKNTQLVTKTALNTFRAFCGEKHPDKTQDFDEIFKEELNKLLVDFYPNARKKLEVTIRGQPFEVFGLVYNDILC